MIYKYYNCTNLTSSEIPSTVKSIGDEAFYYCTNLLSVEIPACVKSIGNKAFFACNKLKSITVEWKETIEFDTDIFGNKSNITLYVPKGTSEIYDREGTWKDFKEIVEYPTPYSFSAPDMEVRLRQTLIMPILMVNKDDIMAYQFDLMLPTFWTWRHSSGLSRKCRLT